MSDFLGQLESTRKYSPPRPDPDRNASLFEKAGERLAQQRETAAQIYNSLNMNISPESYNFLMNGIEAGTIDEDEFFRLATSINIADRYGLPLTHVRENLPAYIAIEGIDPSARIPQTLFRSVINRLEIGRSTPRLGNLMYEFMEAETGGDREHAQRLLAEIERIETRNASLEDAIPNELRTVRDSAKRLLGAGAQTLGYSAYVMAHNLMGRVAGLGLVNFGPLFAWDAGRKIEAGQEYYALRRAGIDPDIAAPLSETHGVISAGIEQMLETLLGLGAGGLVNSIAGKKLSGTLVGRLTSSVFKNLQQNGFLYNLATALTTWALNIPQEFGEEFLQEGDSILFESIARTLQGERWDAQIAEIRNGRPNSELSEEDIETIRTLQELREKLERPNWKENLGRMLEAGIEGGTAAIALGLPGAMMQTGISAVDITRARKAAVTSGSREQFRRDTAELSVFKNIPEPENRTAAQDRVWENMRPSREREESRAAEELRNRRLYGALDKSGDIYRDDDERLYMEHSRHTESGGLITFEFAAGNPHGGEQNSYAIGRGELRGDVPVITELRIGEKYEGLRDEILQNVANDIGKPFEYEGQQYAPNGEGRSLRYGWDTEQNTQNAARGFNFNRAYYSTPDTQADTTAKRNFAEQLKSLDTRLEGDAAARTVVDFYDHLGRKLGMGFDAFMNRMTGGKPDSLLTQELSDAEIARWVAKNEGVAADAEAVQRIQENLTDAQREEAGQNIHGFITPGADGVTKAIYAARNADVSTFIHEGVHAFTQLAKALDPALYRQMIEAAGFSQEEYARADAEGRERMTRQAMETLAYGAEAYLKEGPKSVRNSALKDLYERIKEFLKDLADAAQKGEYLTPEVRALFDSLFGEQAEGARTAQEGQEASATRTTTAMSPEGTQEAAGARQEANAEESAEEYEIYSDNFDRIIKNKSLTVNDRAKAVVRKAGREHGDALLDERDRGHRPTAELIKRARRIPDAAERAKVIAEIRELRKRHAGTSAEFKAPNGKASRLIDALGKELGQQAWYAVRTEGFKKWFGDWELAARIEAIQTIEPKKYEPMPDITKKQAEKIFEKSKPIHKEFLEVSFPVNTVGNLIRHGGKEIVSLAPHLTEIFKNSIYGYSSNYASAETRPDGSVHKKHSNLAGYHHFINKISLADGDHYIRFTVQELINHKAKKGELHSAFVSQVYLYKKKAGERSYTSGHNPGGEANSLPYDSRLAEFFNSVKPDSVSKIVDENGEPLPVFRGDMAGRETFTNRQGVYHASDKDIAEKYVSGGLYDLFLDMKNPLVLDKKTFNEVRERINEMLEEIYEQDWSELEHNEQFQTLRENYLAFRNEEGSAVRDFYNDFLPEVSEDTELDELKDILLKSLHDTNTFEWRQIDYRDIDILNPFIKALGYDGIIRPYDPLGQSKGNEYVTFEPNQIKSATGNAGTFGAETDNIYFQDAFHGSPYRFDRFDSSHMGEGEGNQSFGYGHYLAGKKEVAEWYRKKLKRTAFIYKGEQYVESIEGNDRNYKNTETGEAVDVRSKIYNVFEWLRFYGDKDYVKEQIERRTAAGILKEQEKDESLAILNDVTVDEGQLYEVDIPGDDEMLDWDKPFNEQPVKVRDALWRASESVLDGEHTMPQIPIDETHVPMAKWLFQFLADGKNSKGSSLYTALESLAADEHSYETAEGERSAARTVSQFLNSIGIKGIRYLDGNSRAAGEGSHNYVIFDDNDINITQTFYSESFRDAGLSEFINNYPEVVKEAARFNSGAEMAEHYAEYFAMPDEVYKKARALGYFDALARAAKEGDAENATNAIVGVSAEKAAEALSAYGAMPWHALEAAVQARRGDWQGAVILLEMAGVARIDAETYADTAKMFSHSEMLWLKRTAETAAESGEFKNAPTDIQHQELSNGNEPKKSSGGTKLGKENAAVRKFFDTLVDGAKEIYPDEDIEAQRAELAGEPRTAKAFVDMIYKDKGFDDLIKLAYETISAGPEQGMDEAETQRNQTLFYRARRAFNPEGNWNWKTAFAAVAVNRKVDTRTKKILQGMIRNRPLQYMEAWAMLTGDDTWLPGETDVKRIKRLDTEGLVDEEYLENQSPEELERIGRRLSSDRVKKKIDDKTLLLDDPDLNDYKKQLKEDMAKARALIAERKEGFKEYRRMLDLAEMNARKEQMLLEQGAADTSDEGLKKSHKQTKKLAEKHQEVRNTIAEMERFMREDLTPTQRAAFVELRRQLKEKERIHAELKAIAEIQEIKKRNLRQILRKPDLKTVSVNEAKLIEWVQAHFDSYQAVARFIGRGAKDIRQLYNDFATSAEYRETLKKKLPDAAYHQIERIVFKDLAGREVRAYGEIDARQRRVLYKHLLDHQGIFEELGIDILAEPRQFSEAEWAAAREEMKDRIPADVLYKLEGMITRDKNGNRRFRVENLKDSDLQTLAGVVNKLRKEGREREAARRDARTQLWQEGQEKILQTLKAHMPKNAAGSRMEGIAETRHKEDKRSGLRDIWFGLHNTRRFFRKLEGGVDGYLYDYITQREYDAFDEENRRVFERREKVEKELKKAKIDIKDLGRHRFTLWNGQEASLEEMMTFYYAQYNERALHAVMFGNFASQEERDAIERMAKDRDIEGQMSFEAEIAKRYWGDIKKLDVFFVQGENMKYRQVMEIIGRDFDENYSRLKEFAAREFNEELGSEPYYMPLNRLSVTAEEGKDFENAMADAGHSPYINSGFMKGRVDIPSWGQQPIQAGFYTTWDRMVVKQEHLMAYGSLHREMKQIFQGQGSEALRETLKRGYSEAAVKKVKNFISELAAPPVQEDLAAMNTINRVIRGHYPAAVLGWRIASIVKQAIESPPPFFQYVFPWEYAAAGAACLRQETRDMIYEKSTYMKARYFDPSAAVVHEMEKLYMTGKLGKAEAVLSKIESTGMKGQEWIDAVCVMPGWLAAYNRKLAELNKSGDNMTMEAAEAAAVRYADGIVRDCQPSSVLMDQVTMLKGSKHPFVRMFMQFQTPIASIFQQLFIDAPNNLKHGRILQALWTWGIYALLAMVIGAMHEDDDDDELNPKKRGIDALVMPLEMVPIFGGDMAYAAETLLRNGKIRTPRRSNFPVVDQAVRAVNAVTDEKWDKAAWSVVKGFGYYTGMPVAAMQDIEKAIEDEKWYRAIGIK